MKQKMMLAHYLCAVLITVLVIIFYVISHPSIQHTEWATLLGGIIGILGLPILLLMSIVLLVVSIGFIVRHDDRLELLIGMLGLAVIAILTFVVWKKSNSEITIGVIAVTYVLVVFTHWFTSRYS
jgi:hypothetical protein